MERADQRQNAVESGDAAQTFVSVDDDATIVV